MRDPQPLSDHTFSLLSSDSSFRARPATLRDDTRYSSRHPSGSARALPSGGLRRATITGAIEAGLLPGVLQILADKQSTGVLWLNSPGLSSAIRFLDGYVVDVQSGNSHGDEAFFRLMTAPTGTFAYEPVSVLTPGTMRRTVRQLLLDLAQRARPAAHAP